MYYLYDYLHNLTEVIAIMMQVRPIVNDIRRYTLANKLREIETYATNLNQWGVNIPTALCLSQLVLDDIDLLPPTNTMTNDIVCIFSTPSELKEWLATTLRVVRVIVNDRTYSMSAYETETIGGREQKSVQLHHVLGHECTALISEVNNDLKNLWKLFRQLTPNNKEYVKTRLHSGLYSISLLLESMLGVICQPK